MNTHLIRLLAIGGWTLLSVVGAWAFVVAFAGLPTYSQLGLAFILAAVALTLIAVSQELERLQKRRVEKATAQAVARYRIAKLGIRAAAEMEAAMREVGKKISEISKSAR